VLKEFVPARRPDDESLNAERKALEKRLGKDQLRIAAAKLPVMVIFEGWGAAGKGTVLSKVIKDIDPRFFKVKSFDKPTKEEKGYPFIRRYLLDIPENGKFTFFVPYMMEEVTDGAFSGRLDSAAFQQTIDEINTMERSLHDNGTLILKFFFQLERKEQKKRIKRLEADKNTKWRVDQDDLDENKHYREFERLYDNYLSRTNQSYAPWVIVDAGADEKWTELQVLRFITQGIDTALQNKGTAVPILQNRFALTSMPKLSDVQLADKTLEAAAYRKLLKKYQRELSDLQNRVHRKKIPVIIGYEGWDAAGKGGNIKRVTEALDPRGYTVHPIASPEPHEKNRHYLWRFIEKLPKAGDFAIFDRTWYGRVMVERLEGFCSENDWQRAYNEINEFEYSLNQWGAVIIKFWLQIDPDTQLARFKEREATPDKQWKITDEDWRNRDKWPQYETAVDEMIEKTSTVFAPWHILESCDKKYARVKALKIIVTTLQNRLKA
jgi:polyphosphate:AMP phosphotransferase